MEKSVSHTFVPSALWLETSFVSGILSTCQESFALKGFTSDPQFPFFYNPLLLTTLLACIFFSLLVLHFHFLSNWTRQGRLLRKFSGGAVFPFIGNCYELVGPPWKIQERISNYQKKHGQIARFWLSYYPLVLSTSPELAQKILTSTKDHLDKAAVYKPLHDFIRAGLLTTPAEIWKKDRKIFNRGFTPEMLKHFLEIFNKESRTLTEKLQREWIKETQACGKTKTKNYFPFFLAAGLEIILVTLGKGLNLQEEGENNKFVKAVKVLMEGNHDRMFKPILYYTPFLYRLLGKASKESQALQVVTKACRAARERKIQAMKKNEFTVTGEEHGDSNAEVGKAKAKAILDYLMEQSPQPSIFTYTEHLQTFLGAGSDTSTIMVYQTLFFLALNPNHQQKCHEEVDSILDSEKDPLEITQEQISKAEFLERCWKETMRLRPPLPIFGRNLTMDLVLDDGRVLPKGTGVAFNVWDMHRDPEIYADPLTFDPDRFLPENVAKRKVHSYIPFSYGIRNCIGKKYAQIKSMVFLLHVLAKFTVHTEQKVEDINMVFGVPSYPIPEIELAFVPRK